MRPLTLRPHEARHLARHGRCVVIRAVEPQPTLRDGVWSYVVDNKNFQIWDDGHEPRFAPGSPLYEFCPFGPPGTKLWGREPHWRNGHISRWAGCDPDEPRWITNEPIKGQEAAMADTRVKFEDPGDPYHWRPFPAQSMPRWASRFSRVVHVGSRLCRLSQVTRIEGRDAGHPLPWRAFHVDRLSDETSAFLSAWDKDNPRHPAAGDPWVWVGTIEKQEPTQ